MAIDAGEQALVHISVYNQRIILPKQGPAAAEAQSLAEGVLSFDEYNFVEYCPQRREAETRLPGRPGRGEELDHRPLHHEPLRRVAQRTCGETQSTVGIDFNVRDVSRGGQVYRLQMWDTAGQERYRSLIPTYLKNAQCAIFVYDVTRQSSLQDVQMWQKLFREHQDAPGVLVANKTDLTAARYASAHAGRSRARRANRPPPSSSSGTSRSRPRLAGRCPSSSIRS